MGKNNTEEEQLLDNTSEEIKTNDTADEASANADESTQKSEAENLLEMLKNEQDKYLRLLAEYDNFRKRTAKERFDLYSDATAKAVNDILPVYDNFERAIQAESHDENFKKGVAMIFNMFSDALNKLGVEIIDPLGKEFDPNEAQAINQKEDDNFGENTVCQVFQKGYKLGDKVIRYAMVVVANP